MAMFMKVNELMIEWRDMALITIMMGLNILVIGKTINKMAQVKKYGRMVLNTKGIIKKEKNKAGEYFNE